MYKIKLICIILVSIVLLCGCYAIEDISRANPNAAYGKRTAQYNGAIYYYDDTERGIMQENEDGTVRLFCKIRSAPDRIAVNETDIYLYIEKTDKIVSHSKSNPEETKERDHVGSIVMPMCYFVADDSNIYYADSTHSLDPSKKVDSKNWSKEELDEKTPIVQIAQDKETQRFRSYIKQYNFKEQGDYIMANYSSTVYGIGGEEYNMPDFELFDKISGEAVMTGVLAVACSKDNRLFSLENYFDEGEQYYLCYEDEKERGKFHNLLLPQCDEMYLYDRIIIVGNKVYVIGQAWRNDPRHETDIDISNHVSDIVLSFEENTVQTVYEGPGKVVWKTENDIFLLEDGKIIRRNDKTGEEETVEPLKNVNGKRLMIEATGPYLFIYSKEGELLQKCDIRK